MKTTLQQWNPIKDYTNYSVSSFGNVRNELSRKLLKPSPNSEYPKVVLYKDKKRKTFNVHKLVAQAFLNHEINDYTQVIDHIDFNKHNNKIDNLEIVTSKENCKRFHLKGNPNKYKRGVVLNHGLIFHSLTEASLITGVSISAIHNNIKGLSKTTRIGIWKYQKD